MPTPWTAHRHPLDPRTIRVTISDGNEAPLTISQVFTLLQDDSAFRQFFTDCVRDSGFQAYFWETPPVIQSSSDRPFEFVLVEGPSLDRLQPDPGPFSEHFYKHPSASVLSFPNLSGDAILVVPAPHSPDLSCYTHLVRFLNHAPPSQIDTFWQAAAQAMKARLSPQPLWLSTAGMGVSWLHLRLDSRPKYYRHRPYTVPD